MESEDGRVIMGEVKEAAEGSSMYTAAVEQGKVAGLVEYATGDGEQVTPIGQRINIFTLTNTSSIHDLCWIYSCQDSSDDEAHGASS